MPTTTPRRAASRHASPTPLGPVLSGPLDPYTPDTGGFLLITAYQAGTVRVPLALRRDGTICFQQIWDTARKRPTTLTEATRRAVERRVRSDFGAGLAARREVPN